MALIVPEQPKTSCLIIVKNRSMTSEKFVWQHG